MMLAPHIARNVLRAEEDAMSEMFGWPLTLA